MQKSTILYIKPTISKVQFLTDYLIINQIVTSINE